MVWIGRLQTRQPQSANCSSTVDYIQILWTNSRVRNDEPLIGIPRVLSILCQDDLDTIRQVELVSLPSPSPPYAASKRRIQYMRM